MDTSKARDAETLWSDLDAFYCKTERQLLNPLGYIPLLGSVTGAARIGLGFAQASIASFGILYESFCGILSSDRVNSIRHYDGQGACAEHTIHGVLNIIRGVIELVPCLPLITTAPCDAAGSLYRYRSEMVDCKIIPIEMEANSIANPVQLIQLGEAPTVAAR